MSGYSSKYIYRTDSYCVSEWLKKITEPKKGTICQDWWVWSGTNCCQTFFLSYYKCSSYFEKTEGEVDEKKNELLCESFIYFVLWYAWCVYLQGATGKPWALRLKQKWEMPPKNGNATTGLLPLGLKCYVIPFSIQCWYFLLSWAGTASWGNLWRSQTFQICPGLAVRQNKMESGFGSAFGASCQWEHRFSKPLRIWLNDHLTNKMSSPYSLTLISKQIYIQSFY